MTRVLLILLLLQGGLLISQSTQIVQVRDYLKTNAEKFHLSQQEVKHIRVSDYYYSESSNSHFIYLQQQFNDIDIYNAVTPMAISEGNEIFNSGNGFIPNVSSRIIRSVDALQPNMALEKVLIYLNLPILKKQVSFQKKKSNLLSTTLPGVAFGDIILEKIYFPRGNELILSWRVEIDSKFEADLRSVIIDTEYGNVIHEVNHTLKCSFEKKNATKSHQENALHTHTHHESGLLTRQEISEDSNLSKFSSLQKQQNELNLSKGDGAQYLVYPYYIESPDHGIQELIIDPAGSIASPFGWHDTDGRAGSEFQITKGNNVHAFQDRNDTNSSSDDEPNGGPNLIFDFPHKPNLDVTENLLADVTQLFYMGNAMHDWSYKVGFDEASGNYQTNNLFRGGINAEDDDPVVINALDGLDIGDLDNANFSITSDGTSGRMQLLNFEARGKDLFIEKPDELGLELFTGVATFGPGRVSSDLKSKLVLVDDEQGDQTDACQNIQNSLELNGNIALIRRGTCFFSEKIYNAQQNGAIAAIVCNNRPDEILNMAGADNAELVTIPGYFISKEDCDPLEKALNEGSVVNATIAPNPVRNLSSGFDNGIVAHEYTHGISGRLTGGASIASCLNNGEQMGEGWSDFISLVVTQQENDLGDIPRGIGTYVTGLGPASRGFRRQRYSIDTSINSQTMNDIRGTAPSPHRLGEVWAAILWDIYWLFIDEYGYDFSWNDTNAGNFKAVRLVMDGMRLQPCSPGFIEGRDAILMADQMNFDGLHQCLIWGAFARRGVGFDARGGSPQNRDDNVEGYETLPSCLKTVKLNKVAPPTANVDDAIEIKVTIANHKTNQLQNAVLTNTIPRNAEFISGSSSMPTTLNDNKLSISLGDIPAAEEMEITYKIRVGTDVKTSRITFDDFGPGNNLFNTSGSGADNDWKLSSLLSRLGDNSYNIIDDTLATSGFLTQTVSVLLDQEFPAFSFWHRYITEYGYDGGIVEISQDGGDNWIYIPKDDFLVNGYTVEMIGNPFSLPTSPRAFTGSSGSWVQSFIDLSSYKGQEVLIRFNWASDVDSGISGFLSGWFIDYVEYLDLQEIIGNSCLSSDSESDVCASSLTVLKAKEGSTATNDLIKAEYGILIYPNPTSSELGVSFVLDEKSMVKMSINDLNGRRIKSISNELYSGQNELKIITSSLPNGIYLIQLNIEGIIYNQKFIKLEK